MGNIEHAIFTNMCMIYDEDKILVQDRLNPDWPGITFPGGHVEPKESFVESTIREVKEETGLDISSPVICGVKQFTHSKDNYRYIVLFFKTNMFSGELKSSKEGKVFWIKRNEIDDYILADGFKEMLEVFESDQLSENYHWYDGQNWNLGKCCGKSVQWLRENKEMQEKTIDDRFVFRR